MVGGAVIGLVGLSAFGGVANADPEACYGGVPGIGAHMPAYPTDRVPGLQDAGCLTLHDTSDTSMADMPDVGTWGTVDIRHAGSYPGTSPSYTVHPQSVT